MFTSSKDGALLKTVASSFKSPYQTVEGEDDESGRPTIRMDNPNTYRTARTLKIQESGGHTRNRTISNEPENGKLQKKMYREVASQDIGADNIDIIGPPESKNEGVAQASYGTKSGVGAASSNEAQSAQALKVKDQQIINSLGFD